MRRFWILLATLLITLAPASAAVTITNYNGRGAVSADSIMHRDDGNNAVDAHDGHVVQVGSTFYRYGTSYGCGFIWQVAGSWCGFKVYSSVDMVNWTYGGSVFDPTPAFWQTRCAPTTGGLTGCYELRAIFNPGNSTYVFWFNQHGTPSATQQEQVFTCTTPTCGATPSTPGTISLQTPPSNLVHGPVDTGQSPFVDTDGSCYLLYNHVTDEKNYIDKLNSTCTDGVGISVNTNLLGESSGLIIFGGNYYAVVGGLGCGFCSNGASTSYSMAASVQGTYGASTLLSSTGCSAQLASVDTIVTGGVTTYLYSGDLWGNNGSHNQGAGSTYYQPLTFTGSAIDTLSCSTTVTIPNLTLSPFTIPPSSPDQSSLVVDDYHDQCDTSSALWRMQTFVPTKANLGSIYLGVGQGAVGSAAVNGSLNVLLTTVDGSNNPVATLGSVSLSAASLPFNSTWKKVPISATLSPGTTYAIVLEGANTTGCYTEPLFFGTGSNPYPSGLERISTNAGSTWTTETGRALMFSTFEPVVVISGGGGRRFLLR